MIVRSRRVVLPDGVRPATIHIENGRIARIGTYDEEAGVDAPGRWTDAGDLVVSPGIVDTHVHVNEPGRTEWEGFETATRAAAAGGVTTIVDMPLNSIPATTTVAALEAKRAAARGRCRVDVAFWGGVVPGNAQDLEDLAAAGVRGFKCFLVPSGVDEFHEVGEKELRIAMPIIAKLGVPLLVHAESPGLIRSHPTYPTYPIYETYLSTRPPEAEVEAIRLVMRLAREFGTHVHIVHVASAEAAGEISRGKANGVSVTAETCPHYLTFAAEDVPDGATEFKCAPPIREAHHRHALWKALADGSLDLVATDHSPAPPALKCPGDFMKAWGGIASLELSLSAIWTALERSNLRVEPSDLNVEPSDLNVDLCRIARWMSEAPARLAGIDNRKGRIAPGFDADFIIWEPDAEWTVDSSRLQQRHKLTPYAGRRLRGVVRRTFVRGTCVWGIEEPILGATGQLA